MTNRVKNLLKSYLHPLVWERLGQAKQEYVWTKLKWHCDPNLIPIFKQYLSISDGYYIDVGANDGRSFSNTYHLENSQGWSGVLIEPILHLFFRSQQLRSPEFNEFFNAACVSEDFTEDKVELLYAGLMSITNTESQRYDPIHWANQGRQYLPKGESVQKTWSQARTLNSILEEAHSPRIINLLSIDVEGAEYGVLKGLDLDRWLVEFILIETEIESLSFKYLCEKGFKHIESIPPNILFCHDSIPSQ